MTVRVYTHPACLWHDTGPEHAECPERLRSVIDALLAAFPDLSAQVDDLVIDEPAQRVDAA